MTSPAASIQAEPDGGPHPGAAPSDWYTSAEILALEQRRLFDRSWALVGTVEQLVGPGAYLTATVGTSPLVVLRDAEGDLRAFHNLCRHRGLPLVEGAGRCGRFLTCGYHQWSYDLLGDLRRVPQAERQFPGLELGDWGLHRASVDTWGGMVFAHPDADAPSLSSHLGFLAARLAPFLYGPLVEVACVQYPADCNWKLLVENHIDVYHLWYVHSRSLSMYDHRRFEWDWDADNWWSLEPPKQTARTDSPLGWLPEPERYGIGAHLLFPNLMIVTTGRYFATYDATPVTPESTRLTLRIRATVGADPTELIDSVRSFFAEDVAVCELLQRGIGASRFATGPLAVSHEAPIRAFHAALRSRCYE